MLEKHNALNILLPAKRLYKSQNTHHH